MNLLSFLGSYLLQVNTLEIKNKALRFYANRLTYKTGRIEGIIS